MEASTDTKYSATNTSMKMVQGYDSMILQSYVHLLRNCFKEVLGWLSTAVCGLLLIVPTINRFVINN